MAWPTDPQHTFLRDPEGIYKHDGFGHDNRQDAGIRPPCFRVGPHSGLDFTGRGPIYSLAGGKLVHAECTTRAGFAGIEDVTVPGLGRFFPVYFHAQHDFGKPGRRTDPGERISTIGDTGTGTSKGAFHLHLSIATSLASAISLIRSGTPPRWANESVAQWAARAGLRDPLPIVRALADMDKPAIIDPQEGDPLMFDIIEVTGHRHGVFVCARGTKPIRNAEERTSLDQVLAARRKAGPNQPYSVGPVALNRLRNYFRMAW